jgi:hypothetical protein
MDDGYDGTSSGETSESTAEIGSESGAVDTAEVSSVTDAETAAAFDENGDGSAEADPDAVSGAEKGVETGSMIEAPTGDGKDDITEAEVASAFDEDAPVKSDVPMVPATKSETTTSKVESTEPTDPEKGDNPDAIHVNCTREDLAGMEHPETGVPYETKVVEVNGKQLEVTVPKFESSYDFKLESDQLQLDRQKHNDICNAKLKEHCEANPDWASETFSQKQLDQIKNGKNPEGYTWHHDGGEVGHMQLVDSKVHHDTRHTGGIAIWGNKSKYT